MKALKIQHPDTWHELENGNISVTKSEIPFVSIGADHACEQLNRTMKVSGGLSGISNNQNARQRFFLTSHEMASFATDFKSQFLPTKNTKSHHELTPAKIKHHHTTTSKLKDTIASQGNPFAVEGNSIHNFISYGCIPDNFVEQILKINTTGQALYKK